MPNDALLDGAARILIVACGVDSDASELLPLPEDALWLEMARVASDSRIWPPSATLVGLTLARPLRKNMRMAVRVPVNMTLPRELVERLDAVVGPRQRSAFVEEAINYRLRREEMRRAWESARGMLKDDPRFPTSDAVVEWVRALRAEKTDPGPAE
ncbi:MAG: hypothetical protein ABI725_06740 [Chloroflexota bacterium]